MEQLDLFVKKNTENCQKRENGESEKVTENIRILIVDDDRDFRQLLRLALEQEGFLVKEADSYGSAKELITQFQFDSALVDVYLEGDTGLNLLSYILKEAPRVKVFIMTAQDTVSLAVSAMELGAKSFLQKSQGLESIITTFKQKIGIESRITKYNGEGFENVNIIGNSAKIQMLLARIQQMKNVDSTVLILGESGTGKELVASALHNTSSRKCQRFEAINCGAIPENLLESELFGHKRGAFTDAKTDKKGLFEVCSKGTLLLDEIGEMPLSLQVKLLRVLQEREIRPLGGTSSIKIDTRVIASTHRDLFEETLKGGFRQDLYFRLSVLQLWVPSLRERKEDIPLLVNHFIDVLSLRFGKLIKRPNYEIMSRLVSYSWPGNVRELQNAIERAVVLSPDGEIHIEDIFADRRIVADSKIQAIEEERGQASQLCFTEAREVFEKNFITDLLEKTSGNISQMARLSGKHRVEIYRMLEKYHIDYHEYRKNRKVKYLSH